MHLALSKFRKRVRTAAVFGCLFLAIVAVAALRSRCSGLMYGGHRRVGPWSRERPANHIYLLKTHKCASTTLQRIVIVYGVRRNLSFALPASGGHQFWPRHYDPTFAKRTFAYPTFDIMAVHAKHSPWAMRRMPPDTAYLSVVRDPAEHLQSAFEYYGIGRCLGNVTFERFVQSLASDRLGVRTRSRRCAFTVAPNMQLSDFGFDATSSRSATALRQSIRSVDQSFHAVLVAERFDESLALAADVLGWTDDDLIYFRANARASQQPIGDDLRRLIYAWSWGDKMLYDHFRSKLDAELACRREHVASRVAAMQRLREHWLSHCVGGVIASHTLTSSGSLPAVASGARPAMAMYMLSDAGRLNETCALLTMSEERVIEMLHRLWPEVPERN